METDVRPAPPEDSGEAAVRPAPVMDVVAPARPAQASAPAAHAANGVPEQPAAGSDVAAAPATKKTGMSEADIAKAQSKPAIAPVQMPKKAGSPGSGVGAAIAATVTIVIALAGLAVLAYLKQ